jgi:transposase InsO family protein
MARPYPKEFRDDVLRAVRNREDGVTIEQIAADFWVHPMTLSKWLPAKPRGSLDHRRPACRGVEGCVRRDRRAAEDAADGQPARVHLSSAATVLRRQDGNVLHPARDAVEQRTCRILQQPLRKDCLNRNHWNTMLDARVAIGDFKHEHNHRHRHSAMGYRTPAEYAAACRCAHTPMACEIN